MIETISIRGSTYTDDGCDWTEFILWQMNAGARARSRSVFVPAPHPVQVVTPYIPVMAQKGAATRRAALETKNETATSTLSAQKLVAIMQGRTLSYQAILTAIARQHSEIKITLPQLQKRVFALLQSNLVDIRRHDDMPVTHFTLYSVDPRFFALSDKNART
ncbi:hypothetical protein [Pseudescherichia sp.]|uniref:hypothetical protein n=1 Tax=Pseudescherichia sp. TaxID=2055881 RepID=UPI0028991681|nr:hypothetical protein [Pseudescherichia sp.]